MSQVLIVPEIMDVPYALTIAALQNIPGSLPPLIFIQYSISSFPTQRSYSRLQLLTVVDSIGPFLTMSALTRTSRFCGRIRALHSHSPQITNAKYLNSHQTQATNLRTSRQSTITCNGARVLHTVRPRRTNHEERRCRAFSGMYDAMSFLLSLLHYADTSSGQLCLRCPLRTHQRFECTR